jgi:cytochrome c oxidase cbb3-type subunit I
MGRVVKGIMTRKEEHAISNNSIHLLFGVTAFTWLFFGIITGIILSLKLYNPSFLNIPWLSFGRLVAIHSNILIYGFGLGLFASITYALIPLHLKIPLQNIPLIKAHFFILNGAVLGSTIGLIKGYISSTYLGESIWAFDIAIFASLLLFLFLLYSSIKKRRVRIIPMSIRFAYAFALIFPILFLVLNLQLPHSLSKAYSFYPTLFEGIISHWAGPILLYYMVLFLASLFTFGSIPIITGTSIKNYKTGPVALWVALLATPFTGHFLPFSFPFIKWIAPLSGSASILTFLSATAIITTGITILRHGKDSQQRLKVLRQTSFLPFIMLFFYGLSITLYGLTPAYKILIHSNWISASFHLGMVGGITLLGVQTLLYLATLHFEKEDPNKIMYYTTYIILTIGSIILSTAMILKALRHGQLMNAVTLDQLLVYPISDILPQLRTYDLIISYGGGLILLSIILFLISLWLISRSKKEEEDTLEKLS